MPLPCASERREGPQSSRGCLPAEAQYDTSAIVAFLQPDEIHVLPSPFILILARIWQFQLHKICTSHASRPPAYVAVRGRAD